MEHIAAITGDELRKALVEVEKAEAAGFTSSQAVFYLTPKNSVWGDGEFADICEKAHPTDGRLDWGRDNFMVRRGVTFRDGKLVQPKHEYAECGNPGCETAGKHCEHCGESRKVCMKRQAS